MANTPFTGIEDTSLLVKIQVEGTDLRDAYAIQSVYIDHAVNTISTARLVLIGDVDTNSGDMPITDSDELDPGKKIEIFAGYGGAASNSIFKGIIVKHGVKLDTETHYSFIIECRHEAVKMTYNETENYFENQADDAIITSVISDYGISCTVGSCSETNAFTFQKMSTDWNFILSRSNFNGFLVTMDGDAGMVIDKPAVSGQAVLKIEAGISMLAFDGTLDAEDQPFGITASAWDPNTQSLLKTHTTEPTVNSQGNIKPTDLSSKLPQHELNLVSATPMTPASLQQWADSTLLRKRLHAYKGTVKFFGNALAKTGSIIEITGVGKKLSGQAFVSGVTHVIESQNWNTTVSFGLDKEPVHDSPGFSYPPAMGQVPGIQGLQLATVKQIDQDPENLCRIQVELPAVAPGPNYVWARMAHFYASRGSGSFFLPEIGDEVVLGFLDNDGRFPVILGSLYSGNNALPYTPGANNYTKAFVTYSRMKIEFDEEKKNISICTPGNNSIVISDDGKSIEIKDQNSNSIKLSADGIVIDSAKDVKISAKGNITMNAVAEIAATATQDLKLKGMNINADAQVGFTARGNATAEISASGQTTVKGGIVMIN